MSIQFFLQFSNVYLYWLINMFTYSNLFSQFFTILSHFAVFKEFLNFWLLFSSSSRSLGDHVARMLTFTPLLFKPWSVVYAEKGFHLDMDSYWFRWFFFYCQFGHAQILTNLDTNVY